MLRPIDGGDGAKGEFCSRDWQTFPIQPVNLLAGGSGKPLLGLLAANHKPGYAVNTIEGWRSIYLGAAPAPAVAWREIARYAGAQIINEDSDVLYADRSWLAQHTDHSGPREISLPFRAEGVFELFGRNQVAGATEHFSFNADKWKTYLFYLGPFSNLPAVLNYLAVDKHHCGATGLS